LYDGDGKIEVCANELYAGQDKILSVSCYKQPHIKIKLRVRKKFFTQFEGKFLIGGDFNGHKH
jgi:demethoxyubiquinone hydroxylase (CLK1/Coq7/Cat5 family)